MLRKFVNDPASIVDEMIAGFVGAFPTYYEKHPDVNAVLYRQRRKEKAALVIGGGSGHEPMFAGFVGKGLADAAVCGNIYNAPDPETIYQTAKSVESGKGVVLLYGTYAGDRMNFDLAAERLQCEGIECCQIRVHDDITSAPVEKKEERRGISGDVYMIRLIGAACDAGLQLDEITRLADHASERLWSIGAAITTRWNGMDSGAEEAGRNGDYIEYGIGLHGELGILRTKLQPVDRLVDKMYGQFLNETGLKKGDEVCVLVNGLGAISVMELSIVFQRVKYLLDSDGIIVYNADFNNYCASYTSDGFAITMLRMDDILRPYYDAACCSPYYHCESGSERAPAGIRTSPKIEITAENKVFQAAEKPKRNAMELTAMQLRDMLRAAADEVIGEEAFLSRLDSVVGDGDHGICVANGMRKAKQQLAGISGDGKADEICRAVGRSMLLAGGASGVFLGSMFLVHAETAENCDQIGTAAFAAMWRAAERAVEKRGGARRGEKTMLDALGPAADALEAHADEPLYTAVYAATEAAKQGVMDTKDMTAKFGRGKFVAERALGCQDAGATTIWVMFRGMLRYLDTE